MKHAQTTIDNGRKGIAMVLVLVVVGVTGVLAMSVLSTSTLQARVAKAPAEQIERGYLAESGLTLAIDYLRYPVGSPVPLIDGDYGNKHYPGEDAVAFPGSEGRVSVSVTNTANGRFELVSVATLHGTQTVARATVLVTRRRTFGSAVHTTGNVVIPNKTNITGGLTTTGTVTGSSNKISGPIVATNALPLGGSLPTMETETNFPLSITKYIPYYFYKGQRYTAAYLPSTVYLPVLFDPDVLHNPCNVWYAQQDTQFMLSTTVAGTIIVRNSKNLTLWNGLTVTPTPLLPAVVVDGDLKIFGNATTTRLNGLVYVGGMIKGNGNASSNLIINNGSLICGSSGWPVQTSTYKGTLNINYGSSGATVTAFADEIEPIIAFKVTKWEVDTGAGL